MAQQLLLSHLNTLLFGVISMGICATLLFMLAVPMFQGYFVFFLTTGIGLMIVTLMAFAAVVNNDTTALAVSTNNSNISVTNCPDYFHFVYGTTGPTNGGNTNDLKKCESTNILYNFVLDTSMQITITGMKYGTLPCEFISLPTSIDMVKFTKQSDATICDLVNGGSGAEDGVKFTPWTNVRPFCPNLVPYPSPDS